MYLEGLERLVFENHCLLSDPETRNSNTLQRLFTMAGQEMGCAQARRGFSTEEGNGKKRRICLRQERNVCKVNKQTMSVGVIVFLCGFVDVGI